MLFSVNIATRHRPTWMKKVMDSAWSTAKNPSEVEFIFRIDNDDQESIDFVKQLNNPNVKMTIGQRPRTIGEALNDAAALATGEYLICCGDDCLFKTQDWDVLVVKEFDPYPDKILLMGFNDNVFINGEWATMYCVHRNWIKAVGHFHPPYFEVDMGDCWITAIARGANRYKWTNHIMIEHHHQKTGGDPTSRERKSQANLDKSRGYYHSPEGFRKREEESNCLKKFINEHR